MRKIELSNNKIAIVDDEDFESLNAFKWSASRSADGKRWYATRWIPNGSVKMHQIILGGKSNSDIDHLNNDGLDNRRSNLRRCTRSENNQNSTSARSRCGLRGVSWHCEGKRWMAQITKDKKNYHLGLFHTQEDAATAYDLAAMRLYGPHAKLNFERKESHD